MPTVGYSNLINETNTGTTMSTNGNNIVSIH